MRTLKFCLMATVWVLPCVAAEDAAAIVRRSLELDNRNWERAKDYTFQQRTVQREYDGSGKVKKTESEMHDITILYGRPFRRLVEKDGKPLSEKDRQKEDERFEKELEKRRRESEDENSKERRRYEKRREEQRQFAKEIPDAFTFKLIGEEAVDGHAAYVIQADPRPGYKPHDMRSGFLPKLHGKLWIDKAEYQWVKAELETIDTISIGLFLARLGPGATMRFEQRRVNDQLWLPARIFMKLDGRLALLKKVRGDVSIDYANYRKFQTDTRIIIPSENQP